MKCKAAAKCGRWILFSVLVPLVPVASVAAAVDYAKDVKPLLRERCYSCHGALKQKAKLRLDTVELMLKGGEDGAVIERGKPDQSSIIGRVTNSDPEERMPPPHEGEPFTAVQVAKLREWIAAGAPAPADEKPETDPKEHWAFRSRVRPAVPVVADAKWVRNPVDAFIAKQYGELGLTPQPEASRAVLLRRLYLDLIGLPPTTVEIAAFENDASPEWYERAVNRLLDDPRHGERWARHWMDVWRYSDWWGLGDQLRNSQKHIWHWRDWIVESLNTDTPYDEMIRLMLAADELHPDDPQKLRATGFLARNWFLFNRNTWLDETVEHVSKGFLGITLNCAKCHDHKFDPFAQADYYRMRAFFEPHHVRMDVAVGEADLARDGIPRVFDGVLDTPTYRYVRGEESRPDKSVVILPGVPDLLAFKKLEISPVPMPPEARQPERRPWVADAHVVAARKKVEATEAELGKAKEKLAVAQKRAAENAGQRPVRNAAPEAIETTAPKPAVPEKAKPSPMPADEKLPSSKIAAQFSKPDPARWKLFGGDWSHSPGGLEQKRDGATRAAARLLENAPRDFDATVRFTLRGGSRYRSVGLAFDVSNAEPSKAAAAEDSEILVYASGMHGGPKVQASFARGTASQYPANGMRAMPIEMDREYSLRIQARGVLINVSLDGEPVIAWKSPLARRDGAMQLITFDALAVFHEFSLMPLDPGANLREPGAGPAIAPAPAAKAASPEDVAAAVEVAQRELDTATLAVAAAKAEQASLVLRIAALRGTWARMDSGAKEAASDEEREKVKAAIQSEREAAVAKARHAVADAELRHGGTAAAKKAAAAEKELKAARESLEKATKALAAPIAAADKVMPLVGAQWTPTRFQTSSKDDPKVELGPVSSGRRSALADWIADARNPLTARVAVNHIWARHMGAPLVPTTFDFGRKNAPPAHVELIDWLACELVEHGWSMKHVHRLIVTSAAYRMSSSATGGEANAAKDPDNVRLWRRTPIRIEAEAVRDSILALAGDLDPTIGGPSVPTGAQSESKRRSLYFFHSNNERNLFLTTFDEANVKECYRRDQSIVPQQALALLNSRLVQDSAARIAARIGADAPAHDDAAFVRLAFRGVLGVAPTEGEFAACMRTMEAWRKLPNAPDGQARTSLIWALLNHNDFVTLR